MSEGRNFNTNCVKWVLKCRLGCLVNKTFVSAVKEMKILGADVVKCTCS